MISSESLDFDSSLLGLTLLFVSLTSSDEMEDSLDSTVLSQNGSVEKSKESWK